MADEYECIRNTPKKFITRIITYHAAGTKLSSRKVIKKLIKNEEIISNAHGVYFTLPRIHLYSIVQVAW